MIDDLIAGNIKVQSLYYNLFFIDCFYPIEYVVYFRFYPLSLVLSFNVNCKYRANVN